MSVLQAGQEEDDPGPSTVPSPYTPYKPSRLSKQVKISSSSLRSGSGPGWNDSDDSDEDREHQRRERRASSVGRRNCDLPEDERMLFSDTDEEAEGDMSGAAKAEASQAVW